jgi:hypothetical protein
MMKRSTFNLLGLFALVVFFIAMMAPGNTGTILVFLQPLRASPICE